MSEFEKIKNEYERIEKENINIEKLYIYNEIESNEKAKLYTEKEKEKMMNCCYDEWVDFEINIDLSRLVYYLMLNFEEYQNGEYTTSDLIADVED